MDFRLARLWFHFGAAQLGVPCEFESHVMASVRSCYDFWRHRRAQFFAENAVIPFE